jgi:hypothetical protein
MPLDDLHGALGDLASKVAPLHEDALPAVRERGRRRRRRRNDIIMGAATVAIVTTVFAGIAVAGHRHAPDYVVVTPGPSSTPTTSQMCTEADLTPVGSPPMPRPERIVKTQMTGTAELEPPAPDAHPLVSPQAIWRRANVAATKSTSYRLLLTIYTGPFPSDAPEPRVGRVLSWVVASHHVPSVFRGPRPLIPGTTTPRPPCTFVDRFDVFDARTGRHLSTNQTDNRTGAFYAVSMRWKPSA